MPKAAWCSECGRYVWMSPEGRCQNGHGPEFLSGEYEEAPIPPLVTSQGPRSASEPRSRAPRVVWVTISTAAVLLVVALAAVSIGEYGPLSHGVPTEDQPGAATSPGSGKPATMLFPDESSQSYAGSTVHSFKPITRIQLDAFVFEEYPDYRVLSRYTASDSWTREHSGASYLLENRNRPRLHLLVTLGQLKPNETWADDGPDFYTDQVGNILTTEDVFSAGAKRLYGFLQQRGQDAVVDKYAEMPLLDDAIVYNTWTDDSGMYLGYEIGPQALTRALQNPQNAGENLDVEIPDGPNNANTMISFDQ